MWLRCALAGAVLALLPALPGLLPWHLGGREERDAWVDLTRMVRAVATVAYGLAYGASFGLLVARWPRAGIARRAALGALAGLPGGAALAVVIAALGGRWADLGAYLVIGAGIGVLLGVALSIFMPGPGGLWVPRGERPAT